VNRLMPSTIDALAAVVAPGSLSTCDSDLEATSHDTWPLSTKWAMVGRHPNKGDVLIRVTSFDQVVPILEVATRDRVPVTVRALASSVTGQPLPVMGGIVLDVCAVPAVHEVNLANMTVTVTASHNGGALEDALQARGLTTGHSPQSLYRSTVGGWLSTLATGQYSSLYGGIEDLVVGYTVILATGETVELKASPRAAMGPDLRQIFLGSEGTLGVITTVTLKVFRLPETQLVQTFTMPSVHAGLEFLREQASLGLRPFLVRLYDTEEARHAMGDTEFPCPVLFLGSRGVERMAVAEMETLTELAERLGGQAIGPAGVEGWLARRFDFATVERLLASSGGYAETIEVAHNWDTLEELHRRLKAALAPLSDEVLAHFSHVYTQGSSMYLILLGHAEDDAAAIDRIERIWATAMDTCLELGAELSHHHGGGLARSPYSRRSLGSAHLVLRKLKAALDPAGILNPGKLGL
jgi:alkyldihydroxyacetonephosphate synthase